MFHGGGVKISRRYQILHRGMKHSREGVNIPWRCEIFHERGFNISRRYQIFHRRG